MSNNSKLLPKMTERDYEVLNALRGSVDDYLACDLLGWIRPLDLGGSNSSYHSYVLNKLVTFGYADSEQRSAFGSRGSKRYTITELGRKIAKTKAKGVY